MLPSATNFLFAAPPDGNGQAVFDHLRAKKIFVRYFPGPRTGAYLRITTGTDAAEMLMAGATLVGVGSAVWYRGVSALTQINDELAAFMQQQGYHSLSDLRGAALR